MKTHDLTLARNMLGLQKTKFAKKLGHSYKTFLCFEYGDKPIPTKTEKKIMRLLKEKGLRMPDSMDFSDRPYLSLRAPTDCVGVAR